MKQTAVKTARVKHCSNRAIHSNSLRKMFERRVPSAWRFRKRLSHPTFWQGLDDVKEGQEEALDLVPAQSTDRRHGAAAHGGATSLKLQHKVHKTHRCLTQSIHSYVTERLRRGLKKAYMTFFFVCTCLGISKQTKVLVRDTGLCGKCQPNPSCGLAGIRGSSPQASSHVYICKTCIEENWPPKKKLKKEKVLGSPTWRRGKLSTC